MPSTQDPVAQDLRPSGAPATINTQAPSLNIPALGANPYDFNPTQSMQEILDRNAARPVARGATPTGQSLDQMVSALPTINSPAPIPIPQTVQSQRDDYQRELTEAVSQHGPVWGALAAAGPRLGQAIGAAFQQMAAQGKIPNAGTATTTAATTTARYDENGNLII